MMSIPPGIHVPAAQTLALPVGGAGAEPARPQPRLSGGRTMISGSSQEGVKPTFFSKR